MSEYNKAFRKSVIDRIKAGEEINDVARGLCMCSVTIRKWWEKYEESGVVHPTNRPDIDNEALMQYLEDHPRESLTKLARVFGVSYQSMLTKLRNCGYVYERRYVKKTTDLKE